MASGTPQRFSEPAFRRYEACIAHIIEKWPSPVSFDPTKAGLSLETFTCRLRDAITGVIRYSYHSEHFPLARLQEIYQDLCCAQRDGLVIAGPRATLKASGPVSPVHAIAGSKNNETFVVYLATEEVLTAFCLLLSLRLLDKPLLVKVLDPQLLLKMQTQFDIEASLQDDGSTLII